MKKFKPKSYYLLLFFILIFLSPSSNIFSNIDVNEKEYLSLKALGKYEEAIDHLALWTMSLSDPVKLEVNIFRINEMLVYPELFKKGIDVYNKISNNKKINESPFLLARIAGFKNILLLKTGRLRASESIIKSLGYFKYSVIGPFDNSGIDKFEKKYPPENGFKESGMYSGKVSNVSWFDAGIDRTGKIDFENLYPDTSNSFFYLYQEITVNNDGEYYVILGKTGYTDIWVDGKVVFRNRVMHAFHHGQYFLKVHLQPGKHKVLIKTGDSYNGIKLSMRITDKYGSRIDLTDNDAHDGYASPGSVIETSLFPSLNSLIKRKSSDDVTLFHAGYLYYIANVTGDSNDEIIKYLTRIKEDSPYYSSACYCLGKAMYRTQKKENYFKESMRTNSNNIESLTEIIKIKLNNKFYYQAYFLIDKIKKIYRESEYYQKYLAKLFYLKGWTPEARKIGDKLKKTKYPSIGYNINAETDASLKDFHRACESLEFIFKNDSYNKPVVDSLVRCYEKSGKYNKVIKLLYRAISIFPDDVKLRLKLCEMIEIKYGVKSSIPYISSSLKLCPNNNKNLYSLGIAYHKLGKTDLAEYYLRLASNHVPDDYSLKRYLHIINKKDDEIDRYLITDDILELDLKSKKYSHESSLVLLNETAIRVFSDGSYERRVRRVYKLNDENAVTDFNSQYIVVEPSIETVEDLRCLVINKGSAVEISDRYRQSLSDPESRLYYDLEAIIIPFSSLKKGSILDISYTIKNRSGNEYKNYFGKKFTVGSEIRTLLTNIVLSYPDSKKIYLHPNGIEKKHITVERNMEKNIYRILVKNIPPYKKENAMPHFSQVLDSVTFTSHKSWDDLYMWYRSLLRNKIKVTGEMKDALNKIIFTEDSKMDRVRKIYDYITKEIRYVGFELGLGGIQPRSTDMTYHTRMGDCKDISLLLVAMLKEAGIRARLALVRTRNKGNVNLSCPFLGEFNHAICYVELGGGFFLDGTAKNTGFKELASNDKNINAYVIFDKGYKFINTESSIYERNFQHVNNKIEILSNGDALLKRELVKNGNTASYSRYNLKNIKNELLQLNEYWNRKFPGSRVSDLGVDNISPGGPVSYNYNVSIPSFAQTGENDIIFRPFLMSSNYYKNYAMPQKRVYPILFSGKWEIKINIKYIIPRGYGTYYLPENEEFKHNKFDAAFQYAAEENVITISSVIRIKDYSIMKEEYKKFKKFTRFINRKEMERIILIKKE